MIRPVNPTAFFFFSSSFISLSPPPFFPPRKCVFRQSFPPFPCKLENIFPSGGCRSLAPSFLYSLISNLVFPLMLMTLDTRNSKHGWRSLLFPSRLRLPRPSAFRPLLCPHPFRLLFQNILQITPSSAIRVSFKKGRQILFASVGLSAWQQVSFFPFFAP